MNTVQLEAIVERRGDLSCFVRVPATALEALGTTGASPVGVSLGGASIGQRSLTRYDAGTWVLGVATAHLRAAGGLSAGDRVAVELTLPDPEPPPPEQKPPATGRKRK
jgi:hypothetical protein